MIYYTVYILYIRNGLRSGRPGFNSRQENDIYLLYNVFRPAPHNFLPNGYSWAIFLEVKLPSREANHSPQSSAEVKKNGVNLHSLIRLHDIMIACLNKRGDNLTFICTNTPD